jgi:hypothetical protein
VPLARWVDTTTTKLGQSHACTKTRLIGHTHHKQGSNHGAKLKGDAPGCCLPVSAL